ncbi:MAG: hypothetical protein QOH33_491 [Paraburkholderia sp.]|nr:hypothetical protein [Paraburkholderia sp.]
MPNFSDCRRALQDKFSDVFGQERTGYVGRDIFDELRWDEDNELVRCALETVFVADSVVHALALRWVRG